MKELCLQKNQIKCIKHNYSLDHEVQNFGTFQSYIQVRNTSTFDVGTDPNKNGSQVVNEDEDLGNDENEELVIINKKPTDIPKPEDENNQQN